MVTENFPADTQRWINIDSIFIQRCVSRPLTANYTCEHKTVQTPMEYFSMNLFASS